MSALRTATWIGSSLCAVVVAGVLLLRWERTAGEGNRSGAGGPGPGQDLPAAGVRPDEPAADETSQAGPSDPCAARPACREAGRCTERNGSCLAALAAQCEASSECARLGHCGLRGNLCLPASSEHCLQSQTCREQGLCRLLEDDLGVRCGALTHDDCARTPLCATERRCRLGALGTEGQTRCIEAELVVRERVALSPARHGLRGELVLLVDARIAPPATPRVHGKGPPKGPGHGALPADEPRAAASVELRGADGLLRGELTFSPSVTFGREDLGTGTDTFYVTEHVSCSESHWCGPRTKFFEVRGGELARIQAVGPRGALRLLEASASGGSRWKLERRKKPRGADLVVQLEGLVPPGPALSELRYTFSKGQFRFSERRFVDYLPTVAKQPGPWQGELGLHAASPDGRL